MSERQFEVLQVVLGFLCYMEIGNMIERTIGVVLMAGSAVVFMIWLCVRDLKKFRELWMLYTVCMCLSALFTKASIWWLIFTIVFLIIRMGYDFLRKKDLQSGDLFE